ncbi:hypothetical protein PVAP13_5NG481500 [Panicum virgatum]|uniref:Uncharacterized protein n=1 Tax=Panicum virgatum TaxID=38727 RepID=A0A8T0RXU4_PANVG|nr:hypothetical protein PVAP13_5NG481500 [Panicum virgatum]
MDKATVVLYSGLGGIGHLTPMVQLSQLFVQHGVAVTVALVKPQEEPATSFSAEVARAAAANPSITFHVLLPPPCPAEEEAPRDMFDRHRLIDAPLRDFLRSLPAVRALVLDMFCAGSLDVATELGIPAYFFFASGATILAIYLNLSSVVANMGRSFAELGDSPLSLPGAPPFRAADLPKIVLDDDDATRVFVRLFERMPESNGILVNTYESLGARAVHALRDGACVPGRPTPPVYCVGPLVTEGGDEKHECLEWLDAQPDSSVVFLSFGSRGTFPKKQLQEIAVGLEKSEQRFLWVVRSPRSEEQNFGDPLPGPEPDLDALLPEGFLERTKHQGLVVRSWAPQVEVLGHRTTGAFMPTAGGTRRWKGSRRGCRCCVGRCTRNRG